MCQYQGQVRWDGDSHQVLIKQVSNSEHLEEEHPRPV